ncbi:MAG: carbohydrate ABC transporter permease [Bacillota bacterium]
MVKKRLNLIAIYAGLLFVAALLVVPMIWVVLASFKRPADLFQVASWLPRDADTGQIYFSLDGYRGAFAYIKFATWMKNTLFVAITNTVASTFFNTLAGYAFARLRFPGREGIFRTLLIPMMIPGTVTLVPTFLIVLKLGAYDTLWALIWPSLVWIGTIFLFRQQFLSLPASLEEAARIDGANWFQVYFNIGLPAVRPMLITNAVFCFLGHYNDFFYPSIVLLDANNYTLALGLAALVRSQDMRNYHIRLAAAVLMSLPLILVFLPFQKQIQKGFIAGELK